jgi:hypothetical protein
MKRARWINVAVWLYVWLSGVLNPVGNRVPDGQFWSEKGHQLFRLNENFDDPARLLGNAVLPLLICVFIDWLIRRWYRRHSRGVQ